MSTFAIIETGGKQYLVQTGREFKVEKLSKKEGETIEFNKVLLVSNEKETKIGNPYIRGASVTVTLVKQGRGKKIRIMRYHSKTRHRRRKGHRQHFSNVAIKAIK